MVAPFLSGLLPYLFVWRGLIDGLLVERPGGRYYKGAVVCPRSAREPGSPSLFGLKADTEEDLWKELGPQAGSLFGSDSPSIREALNKIY